MNRGLSIVDRANHARRLRRPRICTCRGSSLAGSIRPEPGWRKMGGSEAILRRFFVVVVFVVVAMVVLTR
jgi:hypothetical protein